MRSRDTDSDILERLHALVRPRTYLQLGARQPERLTRARCGTVLVDPDPQLPADLMARLPWLKLYAMAGDAFFAQERPEDVLDGDRVDLAVIDGVSSLDQLARDLRHIERWSHHRTCAAVFASGEAADTLARFVALANHHRPDLRVHRVADASDPLLLVSGFDPGRNDADGLETALDGDREGDHQLQESPPVPLAEALPPYLVAPVPVESRIDPGDWEAWTSLGDALRPPVRREVRAPRIVFARPLRGAFRVEFELAAGGMTVLRLRCRGDGPGGERTRDVYLDVGSPGALIHELDRVTLAVPEGDTGFVLELEGGLEDDETLLDITLDVTNHWGRELPPEPAMALHVHRAEAWQIPDIIERVPFAASHRAGLPRLDKRRHGKRDAVIFAWFVQERVPELGDYYLHLLRHHHADSKVFVGMNHGSDPAWADRLSASGLDVQICWARPEIRDHWDTTGFLTALEGFHHDDEAFDLVWFGHTKGGSQPVFDYYSGVRFLIDRTFWSRREAVERAFADPKIGLFAARYNVYPTYPWEAGYPGWAGELEALRRMYRERYAPLGLNAYETFFTLRSSIVRRFCEAMGSEFFTLDPAVYGAGRWFYEMAFPSIASMQGYEPFIPMDVLGANDPRDDLNMTYDMKQNHRLALAELERWRHDPFDFQPRVVHWDHPAWDRVRGLQPA